MKKTLFFLWLGLILSVSCTGGKPAVEKSRGIFEVAYLHAKYKMLLSNNCSAGAALVLKDGKVLYEEYLGSLDRSPGAGPVTASSRFPFYSISKEFGVALLFSLVTDGLLGLDDPVVKYFDYFKGTGPGGAFPRETVTVRQLASHTSGVTGKIDTAKTGGQEFAEVTLEFEPGTGFHYNELGMKILGRIMEKVGGKPYEELLKERIILPLGLTSVGYLRPGDETAEVVRTCDGPDSAFVDYSPPPYPGSGLFGTMRDVAAFGRLWLDKGRSGDRVIFKPELVQEAWTNYNHFGQPYCDTEYGMMFWLSSEDRAAFMAGAAQSVAAILPEQNMIVLIGLNQYDGSPGWGRPPVEHSNVARLGLYLNDLLKK
jgi:CubicO group peptidase (beta-lactamase class C family)